MKHVPTSRSGTDAAERLSPSAYVQRLGLAPALSNNSKQSIALDLTAKCSAERPRVSCASRSTLPLLLSAGLVAMLHGAATFFLAMRRKVEPAVLELPSQVFSVKGRVG
jgi:hypothetical protein